MRKLSASLFAAGFFLAATPASACMPPMVPFAFGSLRLAVTDLREIARGAAAFRDARPGARLRLSSYLDLAGSPSANRRMARRRGEVVRTALARRGVPAAFIDIEVLSARHDVDARTVWIDVTEAHAGCW